MQTKADQAFRILKERIMDGTYGPGHRLVIDQLVREYGISSVPWRESLRRLEAEGWVRIVPNVGALVRTFDTDAWQQGLSLLARIGGYATALSAPHLTAEDLKTARVLNRRMGEALDAFDPTRFGRLNREFHELLASRAGDDRLVTMVRNEWARLEVIRKSAFWYAPGRAEASLAEHDDILRLIESAADPEAIETAARQHELRTVDAVTRYEAELPRDAV
ncbi:putative GntR family transcriptional regulator [Actinacidiphila reveromycinica]|uniref:Putative GntR family transcriptional regulator n=1 Tax=Actinacidiphila reveromycinica TaxID=659352 RepID=A0A7U3ULQ0_9ACTN|nr:GntR family transcriptional regulator [Streptomyces sp. SN-593]BBA96345.1 putative GntR family transcriptional regulator [Streptomyces sp. SN-593]